METKNNLEKELHVVQTNEVYEKPTIEVIEMEMEGSILAGSAPDYRPGRG